MQSGGNVKSSKDPRHNTIAELVDLLAVLNAANEAIGVIIKLANYHDSHNPELAFDSIYDEALFIQAEIIKVMDVIGAANEALEAEIKEHYLKLVKASGE